MSARGLALAAVVAAGLAAPVDAQRFNWDELGATFCALTTAADFTALRPLLTTSLIAEIEFAFTAAQTPVPPTLFQSYVNAVPECEAETRNAALIEIRRSGPKGAAPSWTEYAVVVPQADGTTRIDDVLFATRRSDTLRARMKALAN